jgi:hypothetical protein
VQGLLCDQLGITNSPRYVLRALSVVIVCSVFNGVNLNYEFKRKTTGIKLNRNQIGITLLTQQAKSAQTAPLRVKQIKPGKRLILKHFLAFSLDAK